MSVVYTPPSYEPEHLFRIYAADECGEDGYPFAWHQETQALEQRGLPQDGPVLDLAVKDLVRENAGNRCLRCGHPYMKGAHTLVRDEKDEDGALISWSPCDSQCVHEGPVRMREAFRPGDLALWVEHDLTMQGVTAADARMDEGPNGLVQRYEVEARWRILTVHHLLQGREGKRNLLWWNLVSLCQRCHLTIQKRVDLQRVWPWPHSSWFRPYAAGWYAFAYLGEHLSREQTLSRLDDLLALEGATTEGEG